MTQLIADRFEVIAASPRKPGIVFARDRDRFCHYDVQSIVVVKCVSIRYKELLLVEEEVYEVLGDLIGFPSLRWSGEWQGLYCIVVDYVGCNFERLHFFFRSSFNPSLVASLAAQMLDLIKNMHSLGYIHGDVKPNNFTLGPKVPGGIALPGYPVVNLIDFETARKCSDSEIFRLPLTSTPSFASINLLRGEPLSKRDDLESLAYTLIFLLPGSPLPWADANVDRSFHSRAELATLKEQVVPEELCAGFPAVFSSFLRYSRQLKPDDEIDYDFFINEFVCVAVENIEL